MSKNLHLITVGKLKDKHLEALETSYLKRISNPNLTIHEVKAKAKNKQQEGVEVIKKVKEIAKEQKPFIIALTEFGKEFESPAFSNWLFEKVSIYKVLIFIIAGAEGHSDEVLELTSAKLSLSKLTFPHKIARILFVEQVYRALTIKNNHPYHN